MSSEIGLVESTKLQQASIADSSSGLCDLLEIIHVNSQIQSQISAFFSLFGLSAGRFFMLLELFRSEDGSELSPADLARKQGVTSPTITGLLDGLERDGLIERVQSIVDRRKLVIGLTKQGRSVVAKMLPRQSRCFDEVLSSFSEEELVSFLGYLNRLLEGIKAQVNKVKSQSAQKNW